MNRTLLKTILWLYVAVVAALTIYFWWSYTGYYRWFAEWQMREFGSYDLRWTAILPGLLVASPALAVLGRLRRRELVERAAAGPLDDLAGQRRVVRVMLVLGVISVVVAAGAGVMAYLDSQAKAVVGDLSLDAAADTPPPAASQVRIAGIARTDLIVTFESRHGGTSRTTTYVPLTTTGWRRDQPIRYVLGTNITHYSPPGGGRLFPLNPRQPPFAMQTEAGALVAGGLPGPVREEYRRAGLVLAEPLYLLEPGATGNETMFIVAGVAGLVGLCVLTSAGIVAWRNRRAARAAG